MRKRINFFLVVIGVIVFIIAPVFIQYYKFIPGSLGNGDWLGFWGSYLGFLPAGLITYIVLEFQFKRQETIDKKNAKDQLNKQKQEFLFECDYNELSKIKAVVYESDLILVKLRNALNMYKVQDNNEQESFMQDLYQYVGKVRSKIDEHFSVIKSSLNESGGVIKSDEMEEIKGILTQLQENSELLNREFNEIINAVYDIKKRTNNSKFNKNNLLKSIELYRVTLDTIRIFFSQRTTKFKTKRISAFYFAVNEEKKHVDYKF